MADVTHQPVGQFLQFWRGPWGRRFFLLLLVGYGLLWAWHLFPQVSLPSVSQGLVDNWQLEQEVVPSVSGVEYVFEMLQQPEVLVELVPLLVVGYLLAVSVWYLLYRFFGWAIGRFRPDFYLGERRDIGIALLVLMVGVGALVSWWGFFEQGYLHFDWWVGALVMFGWLVVLAGVGFLSMVGLVLFGVWRRVRGREFLWKRRLFLAVSRMVPLVVGFLVGWYLLGGMYAIQPFSTGGGVTSGPSMGIANPVPLRSMGGNLLESSMGAPAADSIGLSTGGAKDVNNFRENIANGYLPLPTDVTYEGLFYDYLFDTGQVEACPELFCPTYTQAVSPDPFTGRDHYFLSVGLNSGLSQEDFSRKDLRLVVVLDNSGSMESPFNQYYYDGAGEEQETTDTRSKMAVANESVVALLGHLQAEDTFGMVVFDNQAEVALPVTPWSLVDRSALERHILEIQADGGTNMEAGLREASEMLKRFAGDDPEQYENRIIFLTDAQPNTGVTNDRGLLGITERNAAQGIYTSFIGIGVDFNSELVEAITKVEGANYYAVHSPADFSQRMDENFEYMVTPLVFDLRLSVESDDFSIAGVYGSPEADQATGEVMRVNTLFPSERQEYETRGGLVLLELSRQGSDGVLELMVQYRDRAGQEHSSSEQVIFEPDLGEFYGVSGIRKGVVLSRYAHLLRLWAADERARQAGQEPSDLPRVSEEGMVFVPDGRLSRWERTSVPLSLSPEYRLAWEQFYDYFEEEMLELGDAEMEQELELMEEILAAGK